tara:strand:- start:2214 stop:2870 length:657 start_codon:yes stop_codon:yes gene_type:complete
MCGRYTLAKPLKTIKKYFKASGELKFIERYNIAPKQNSLVIVNSENGRNLKEYRWGLVPHWSKGESIGKCLINTRSETVEEKRAFKASYKSSRSLIPTDGFIEWRKVGKNKQPYYIHLKNRELFGMAGICAEWKGTNEILQTYSILTTEANPLLKNYHDRMPVILAPDNYDLWLNKESQPEQLRLLFSSYPEDLMDIYPISKLINSHKNDNPECLGKV